MIANRPFVTQSPFYYAIALKVRLTKKRDKALGYTWPGAYLSSYATPPDSAAIPLYRCVDNLPNGNFSHFLTINSSCEGVSGASLEAQYGYVETVPIAGSQPLYRCAISSANAQGTMYVFQYNSSPGWCTPAGGNIAFLGYALGLQ